MKSSKEIRQKIDHLEEKYKKALNREKIEMLEKAPTGKLVYFQDKYGYSHLFVNNDGQYIKLSTEIDEVTHNFHKINGMICGSYLEFELSTNDVEFVREEDDEEQI